MKRLPSSDILKRYTLLWQVKMSDGLLRFACDDVFYFEEEEEEALSYNIGATLRQMKQ